MITLFADTKTINYSHPIFCVVKWKTGYCRWSQNIQTMDILLFSSFNHTEFSAHFSLGPAQKALWAIAQLHKMTGGANGQSSLSENWHRIFLTAGFQTFPNLLLFQFFDQQLFLKLEEVVGLSTYDLPLNSNMEKPSCSNKTGTYSKQFLSPDLNCKWKSC